ncbi:MAG: EAL domain-containing protein [Alphaproteobacteria bacterium]|nr:EAL domain-containing protein [Alphaproteobacteria bacterium]
MTIAKRVSLAIGLLLFLFFVTSAVSFLLTKRIEDDVIKLSRIDERRQHAVLEMEVRLADLARAVFAYSIASGAPEKRHIHDSVVGFETSAKAFAGLSSSDEELALGEQVQGLFEESKRLGNEMVLATDSEYAGLAALRLAAEEIDGLLEARIQGIATGAELGAERSLGALHGMRRNVVRGLGAVEAYRASPDPLMRDHARRSSTAFDRFASQFLELAAQAEARAWLGGLRVKFDQFASGRDELLGVLDNKRELLARFEKQRQRVESLLGGEILPLADMRRERSVRDLGFSTQTAIVFLVVMTGIGVLVGTGTAVFLTRRIVRPILELTAGVDAIGRGILDHRISVESGDEMGQLAVSFNRMADTRQRTEETLRDLSHHDSLTKLPNRILFQLRLVEALDNAQRVNRMVAVHFLDLDHFKDINDTLGHPAGDLLLQIVAERLKVCIRRSDTVARLGGDEFAILQTNLVYSNGIMVLAKRLIDTMAKPFEIEGERVFTGTSIGITIFPHDDEDANKLLKNADLALYRAKQEGRNKFQLYDPEMNAEIQARKALEQDIREALDNAQFFLCYQPQLELSSGRISGAEALVRWRHPKRGMVSPAEFIPVAEQTGLILQLTEGVLLEACTQIRAWQDAGLPPLRVSVNLSPADFKRKDLISMIKEILEETDLSAEWLELEITEGMVMSGVEAVIATLHELAEIGIELAIDDFGTGFSSMSYLKQFPVHRLKIDQTFVRDIIANKEDASITKAITMLGHSFGLRVVAEGVETREQLEFLRLTDCDEIQGYYFSRPLEADAFAEFLAGHSVAAETKTQEIA